MGTAAATGSAARTPVRGFPPGRDPAETPADGFSAWHTPGEPLGPDPTAGAHSDDTYIMGSLPPGGTTAGREAPVRQDSREDPGQDAPAGRDAPRGRRRGARPKRRGPLATMAWLAAGAVALAGAGFAGYKYLYEPRVNAPVSPTLRLPTTVPVTPGTDKALGRWQHIGSRAEDPQPLTIADLFPPQFEFEGASYVRTAASITKNCILAVYGQDLQAALQAGHCTQVVRASYISGTGAMMGTIGVINLVSTSAAQKAGQVTGPKEIIAPLTGKKGPTAKLGKGTGVVLAEQKGHYLILMWAEYASLKSPSGSAQRQALEQFVGNMLTGSANINLSTRMLTGKP